VVAPIETPLALLKEPLEVILLDTIDLTQMSFCLVPEVLDVVDMIVAICKELTMIDPVVMKSRYVQSIVRLKGICIHHAIWLNVGLYYWQ
jgi:hypothetical protein